VALQTSVTAAREPSSPEPDSDRQDFAGSGSNTGAIPAPQTGTVLNNFIGSGSGPFKQDSFDTRVDFAESSTLNVFGRFSLDYFTLSGKGLLGAVGGPGNGLLGLSGSSNTHNYSLATGFTKTLSASLLTTSGSAGSSTTRKPRSPTVATL